MATKIAPKTSSAPSKSAPKAAAPAPATKAAAAPAPAAKAAPAPAKASYQPTQDEIAARAYAIYEREGGNDHDNWLRAERELIARGRK